jgi:broad specificity phosphatase PhoE
MTKILLIRHALTESVGKYISGRAPGVFLNEEGKRQALMLANKLKRIAIDAIYSSPLERTLETAETIAKSHQLLCKVSCHFQEIDFGDWTNCTIEELKNNKQFRLFNSYRSVTRIPGGETISEAQIRMIKGIELIREQHHEQTIAIISHMDMIRSAIAFYAGIPLDMFHRLEISPASVSILEMFEDTARLLLVNDTGYLQ